jgi:hypothetical protein
VTAHVNAKDDRWRFEFTQACLAPTFRIEAEGPTVAYVALFPDLFLSFDLVERLIEAAAEEFCEDEWW